MSRVKIIIASVIFIIFASGALAQSNILFSDTFTGREGTRPPNWTVIQAPEGYWYLQNGQFTTGNGDDITSQDGYSYAIVNSAGSQNWTDYSVQCSMWLYQQNGRALLVGRWMDKDNHYEGVIETYQGKRMLRIEKILNGRRTTLAQAVDGQDGVVIPRIENGTSPADAHQFVFTLSGSRLSMSMDGTKYVEVDDTSFSRGAAGLGEWYHFAYFDDFIVREITPGAPAEPVSRIPTEVQTISQPSQPSGPQTIYRILIGRGLQVSAAEDLKNQLIEWGYTPVEVYQTPQGNDVYLGAFYSESEAADAKSFLEEEGLTPQEIVALSGEQAVDVKQRATTTEKMVHRVMANEFPNRNSAQEMKNALENDGYFPVDIAQAGGNYRVYIGSFNNSEEAQKLSSVLKQDGYGLAQVVEETSAASYAPPAASMSVASAQATPEAVIPSFVQERDEWLQLSPQERQQVEEAIMSTKSLQEGNVLAQEILNVKQRLNELSQEQRKIVSTIQEDREQERQRRMEIASLFEKANRARDAGNLDEAEQYLAEVKKIDNTNARIDIMMRSIENLRKNVKFEGQEYLEEQNKAKIQRAREDAQAEEQKENFEVALRNWETVRDLAKPGSIDEQQARTAIGRLRGMIQEREEARKARERKWQYMIYGIAALIVILLVAIVIFGLRSRKHDQELLKQVQELTLKPLIDLKNGKGQQAIEDRTQAVQPAASSAVAGAPPSPGTEQKPPPAPEEPEAPEMPPEPEPASAEKPAEEQPEAPSVPDFEEEPPEVKPAAPAGAKATVEVAPEEESPVPDIEDIRKEPEELEKSPEAAVEEPEMEEQFQSVSLDDLGEIGSEEMEKEEVPPAGAESEKEPVSSVDIDDLLGVDESAEITEQKPVPEPEPEKTEKVKEEPAPEAKPEKEVVEAPAEMLEEKPGPVEPPKTEVEEKKVEEPVFEKQQEEKAPAKPQVEEKPAEKAPAKPEKTAEPAEAKSGKEEDGTVFEQDFSDVSAGELPDKWKGDYPYASMVVSEEFNPPSGGKALLFNKEKGAGSAFYSCHFPDVGGTVGIEFDFRCDNKNKYLLGFYVEKDEDYRYSVHTVIQYIDSGRHSTKPSLRIQGKPIGYEWGQWRHIKYIVDLKKGSVDGWVDGELVASGERLASCPDTLNTISIRDNLATVGKLMVGNIKIYKVNQS